MITRTWLRATKFNAHADGPVHARPCMHLLHRCTCSMQRGPCMLGGQWGGPDAASELGWTRKDGHVLLPSWFCMPWFWGPLHARGAHEASQEGDLDLHGHASSLTLSPRSIEFECPTHQVCLEPWIDVQKPAWRGTGGRRARQTRSSCARPSTPKLLVTAQTRHTRQRASRSGAQEFDLRR